MTNMNDIRWLAGYLEGEGCFAAQKDYRYEDIWSIRITVGSIDMDVIIEAACILTLKNPKLYKSYANRKKFYQTRIYGNKAIGWMMTLYPLMGERRKKQIKEVIAIWRRNA